MTWFDIAEFEKEVDNYMKRMIHLASQSNLGEGNDIDYHILSWSKTPERR